MRRSNVQCNFLHSKRNMQYLAYLAYLQFSVTGHIANQNRCPNVVSSWVYDAANKLRKFQSVPGQSTMLHSPLFGTVPY